jgi:glycerol-3-phosphate dehydrogenase subunit C
MSPLEQTREGSLEAPTRHALDWKAPSFYDEAALLAEMTRVFDVCHGCRRCVSLCQSFPTLFDLVDASASMEVDGVAQADFWKVVDQCYLCDLCYMTKCPYVPPHEWTIDFPHLMLRAKAVKFRKGEVKWRDRLLTATDAIGRLAGIPVVAQTVNAVNCNAPLRKAMEKVLGVHAEAPLPAYHGQPLRRRLAKAAKLPLAPQPTDATTGKVALFATCYGNYNAPQIGEDLVAVFAHNGIPVSLVAKERCCGMPKLELGDLDAVEAAKEANIPVLAAHIEQGFDIVMPVPSCALMFKQELPLLFPGDERVQRVAARVFDPFEYLALRHKAGQLRTDFRRPLGKVAYHVACHLRVQNLGLKTRDMLALVPGTTVEPIERCSGHDGTYAVKREFHDNAMKIARPVVERVRRSAPDHYGSDCPMAGRHIGHGLGDGCESVHPMGLLRKAYGI